MLEGQKEIPVTGDAYLEIADYNKDFVIRLLERTARQAMRDGAKKLYVSAPDALLESVAVSAGGQTSLGADAAEPEQKMAVIHAGEFTFEKCERPTERGVYRWISIVEKQRK